MQGFITNLATTVLQNALVFLFLNRNVKCFLKQKSLRCFSVCDFIIPFRAFSYNGKVRIYSPFALFSFNHKRTEFAKNKNFLLRMHFVQTAMNVSRHILVGVSVRVLFIFQQVFVG